MPTFDRRATLKLLLALFATTLGGTSRAADGSNFATVYGDPKLRERFFPFLRNVFRLYPEDAFHRLIRDVADHETGDDAIYRTLQARLPEMPYAACLTRAPALRLHAGAGDGWSDACPITGGESTENEMFILIGSYYVDPAPGAAALAAGLATGDARARSTYSDVALPPQMACGASRGGHARHAGDGMTR